MDLFMITQLNLLVLHYNSSKMLRSGPAGVVFFLMKISDYWAKELWSCSNGEYFNLSVSEKNFLSYKSAISAKGIFQ